MPVALIPLEIEEMYSHKRVFVVDENGECVKKSLRLIMCQNEPKRKKLKLLKTQKASSEKEYSITVPKKVLQKKL